MNLGPEEMSFNPAEAGFDREKMSVGRDGM